MGQSFTFGGCQRHRGVFNAMRLGEIRKGMNVGRQGKRINDNSGHSMSKYLLHPNCIRTLPILYPHILLSPWKTFLGFLSYGVLFILLELFRTLWLELVPISMFLSYYFGFAYLQVYHMYDPWGQRLFCIVRA